MGRNLLRQLAAIVFILLTSISSSVCLAESLPVAPGFVSAMPLSVSDMLPSAQGLLNPEVFSPGMDQRPLVTAELRYFQGSGGLRWLEDGMRAAEPWRDFIVSYLSEKHMPMELYYVAMIESTFNIKALSRSGAAGLWQFMMNSIGGWMHSNEWVDERFDFWASTKGALEKLAGNYQELADWSLALAAYNAGLGRISKLVKKTGARTFWDLEDHPEMPAETRAYVPRILAAAYVGSHAARYGLPIFWNSPIDWCKIEVKNSIRVSLLEKEAGIPAGILRMGNAELRYDLTPPGKVHYLKVPQRYLEQTAEALGKPYLLSDYTTHIVIKGDTLYSLCRKYATNTALLAEYNPGLMDRQLQIGRKLIIPLVPKRISTEKASMSPSRS